MSGENPTKLRAAYVDAANRFQSFVRGYRHGSGGKSKDAQLVAHATLSEPYLDGYNTGRDNTAAAHEAASKRYGYTPSILRDEESSS